MISMNPFKILKIRKLVKDFKDSPSALAGGSAREVLWGILILPIVICLLGIILFFMIGYTNILGFQWGFFKFLFWVSLFVGLAIFSLIKRIIKSLGKGVSVATKKVIDATSKEIKDEERF